MLRLDGLVWEGLDRFLVIWLSLSRYIEKEGNSSNGKNKQQYEKFLSKLKDKIFRAKMVLWAGFISLMNINNVEFQKSDLEVQKSKTIIQKSLKVFCCYYF